MDIISFDPSKYFLGTLCRHSHDYCETSFSLRYLKCNQRCVECLSKTNRSYQQSEKGKKAVNRYRQSEKGKATKRRHAKSEKGKAARLRHEKTEKRKQSRQAYNQSEKAKQTQQLYNQSQQRKEAYRRLNQTEKRKEYNRRFQKTEQGKAIAQINNSRRRSRKRQNPQIPYTATQIKTLKYDAIAQQFNIGKSTVGRIIRGEAHKSR